MFWRKRKQKAEQAFKTAAEIAGDQIAPGAGKWFLIVGGLAVGAAGAYLLAQRRKAAKTAPPPQ